MKHIAFASILVAIVAALLIVGTRVFPLLPGPATSTQGLMVDALFRWEMYFIAFFFALVVVVTLYAIVAFRRRLGDTGEGHFTRGNMPLEVLWTVIPFIILMSFAGVAAYDLNKMGEPAPDELIVEVTAFQFAFKFHYPQYSVDSTELDVPVGRPIVFRITSLDVVHAFWVPEWRVQQDAVPGTWNDLRITPVQVGDYTVRCNELCGDGHSFMTAPVKVLAPADFDAWVAAQKAPVTPATGAALVAQGQKLAQSSGCLACHTTDGSKSVGPTWKGLYGSEVKLTTGQNVLADATYLHNSIVNPGAQIVAGFQNIMPASYSTLSDADLNALVAYIESLK